jgi:hypothetical protein
MDPAELWEEEEEVGYLSIGYDGATGQRLSVSMNRRQAQLMGASREDLLVLLARYQLPLPLPEADWLACLMHELGHATQARAELYLRGLVGCGAEASRGLVHCVKVKQFDGLGRVTRVSVRRGRWGVGRGPAVGRER